MLASRRYQNCGSEKYNHKKSPTKFAGSFLHAYKYIAEPSSLVSSGANNKHTPNLNYPFAF